MSNRKDVEKLQKSIEAKLKSIKTLTSLKYDCEDNCAPVPADHSFDQAVDAINLVIATLRNSAASDESMMDDLINEDFGD